MKTKEVRGITIISLVVTIVVLLILAGVSVSLVIGNNNLFDKAKSTQKIQTIAGIKEALELEKVDIQVESKTVNLENYLEQISNGKKNYDLSSTEKINDKNAYITINDQYKFLLKDKENGDVEITYEGVAVSGDLTLSSTSGTYTYPTSGTFTVSGNTGTISAVSNNTNIATVSVSGSTVTVKPGTTSGKATITVTSAESSNYNAKSATYTATVKNGEITITATPYTGTYDSKPHNAFTSVTTNPSDAKLEYSINGGTYSTTMPTIKDTSEFTVTVKASKEGYKTQTTTETVKVNKAEGKLTLSSTSGTYTYPTSGTFTVSGNTGTLSAVSNNTNIATVSVSGSTVTVKPGTTSGKATITVTSAEASNYNAKSATYTATVKNGEITITATPYTGTYDGKSHNAFTSVTTNPSDAKLEYSTDGTTYNPTMPTITNASSFTVTVRASKAGYATKTVTETVKVNKAEGKLTLSATSGTSEYSKDLTFTISGNTGTLSVSSDNTNVATASISGSTVTVKPVTAGTTTITVTSAATLNYDAKSAIYTVTVKNLIFTGNSGVGYYADVDGDGTVDGIIFGDYKVGGSGSWGGEGYSFKKISSTKSYYISQASYAGPFGTKPVLTGTGSGQLRFYIVTLNDYNNRSYQFRYISKISKTGWSVPSKELLAAVAGNLGITKSNYNKYGLNQIYWSSSEHTFVHGNEGGFCANFIKEDIYEEYDSSSCKYYVRLVRTF